MSEREYQTPPGKQSIEPADPNLIGDVVPWDPDPDPGDIIPPDWDPDPKPYKPLNYMYLNSNPNPTTICNACKMCIGNVYAADNRPPLPRHPKCFCYYLATPLPVDSYWPG